MDDMKALSHKVPEISYAIHDEDGTIIGEYFANILSLLFLLRCSVGYSLLAVGH